MKKGNQLPFSHLRELRKARKMTQKEVAAKIGATEKSYRAWEKGEHYPDTNYAIDLAHLYGVSVDYILGETQYTNIGNKEMIEMLGLSEDSINILRLFNIKNRKSEIAILSKMLEQKVFWDAIENINNACWVSQNNTRPMSDALLESVTTVKMINDIERNPNAVLYNAKNIKNENMYYADHNFSLCIEKIVALQEDMSGTDSNN